MSEQATDHLSRVIEMLGGWPDYFEEEEKQNGSSILAVLVARKTIDQAVFGLVIRYAVHRAAFDKISIEIREEQENRELVSATNYLSGKEQQRAFHENKTAILERELLATPYARAKAGEKVQTDFLNLLTVDGSEPDGTGKKKSNTVMPFKPLAKKTYGSS